MIKPLLPLRILLSAIFTIPFGTIFVHAADKTWTLTSGSANWDSANWSPSGTPGSTSDIVVPATGSIGRLDLNLATVEVNNWTFSSTAGWTVRSAGSGARSLNINGNLSKSGSGSLTFDSLNSGAAPLSLTIDGNISITAGGLYLGGSNNSTRLSSLTVTGTTAISGGQISVNAVTATFGVLNITTTSINIFESNVADSTGAITVAGLTGTGFVNGRANRSAQTAAVLTINQTNTAEAVSFGGVIRNFGNDAGGTNNPTLALVKTGSGTQVLSGASTYSAGTTISEGTLLVQNTAGSGLGTGSVSVAANAVLGGTGIVTLAGGNTITVAAGGLLMGGNGVAAAGSLRINSDLNLQNDSLITLTLGTDGTSSSIQRLGGTWSFDSDQAFFFVLDGGGIGTYANIITGLALDPGVTNWTIANAAWVGTFSYDSGNVSLNITAVPEPSAWALLGCGLGTVLWKVRRRRHAGLS